MKSNLYSFFTGCTDSIQKKPSVGVGHAQWLASAQSQRVLMLQDLHALQVKERAEKVRPFVKQVKVLRDADKVDAAGKQASKGVAFVEFSEHEHRALCALQRQLNNNPAPFGALTAPHIHPIINMLLHEPNMLLHGYSAHDKL